jgi:hypothetical protein
MRLGRPSDPRPGKFHFVAAHLIDENPDTAVAVEVETPAFPLDESGMDFHAEKSTH